MHKYVNYLYKTCGKLLGFYTQDFIQNYAVEKVVGFCTAFALFVNTLLHALVLTTQSVFSDIYTLSTKPITITTNKLYKGDY